MYESCVAVSRFHTVPDIEGGTALPHYRLYAMNEGYISHCVEFDAADDHSASEISDRLRSGRAANLWTEARKVRLFKQSTVAAHLFGRELSSAE